MVGGDPSISALLPQISSGPPRTALIYLEIIQLSAPHRGVTSSWFSMGEFILSLFQAKVVVLPRVVQSKGVFLYLNLPSKIAVFLLYLRKNTSLSFQTLLNIGTYSEQLSS